jgi:ferredoxin
MKPNVIEIIVQNNLCIGCGVCAAVCPSNVLKMEFNKYGEYNPVQSSGCLEKCNSYLKVCPFYDHNENEDSLAKEIFGDIELIRHRSEIGYYLDSYVDYSKLQKFQIRLTAQYL